jgi:hypothetical protein
MRVDKVAPGGTGLAYGKAHCGGCQILGGLIIRGLGTLLVAGLGYAEAKRVN